MSELIQQRQRVQDLCSDLQEHHHPFVRIEGPRLLRTARALTPRTTSLDLLTISKVLSNMLQDLEPHMFKEEAFLFPYCQLLALSETAFEMYFGSVANPIAVMQADHELCHQQLNILAELTHHYTPPANSPAEVVHWLKSLQLFAEDLKLHIHKEDHQLFPLALQLEAQLQTKPVKVFA